MDEHQPARRAARGSAPAPPSPGRGSSPCPDARPCRSSRPRAGSCGDRSRARAGAGGPRPAAPRTPTARPAAAPAVTSASIRRGPARARHQQVGGVARPARTCAHEAAAVEAAARPAASGTGRPATASTVAVGRPDEREHGPLGRHVGRLDPLQELHLAQVARAPRPRRRARCRSTPCPSSSVTCQCCSTCPCGDSTSASVESPSASAATCCEQIECSQPSRSCAGHDEHVAVAAVDDAGARWSAGAARAAGRRSARGRLRRGRSAGHGVLEVARHRRRVHRARARVLFRRAVAAPSEDREVRRGRGRSRLGRAAAAASASTSVGSASTTAAARVADDMDVLVLGRPVRRCAVAEVGVADEAELLEQFEGAVDGGDVDVRNGVADLLGRGVAERAHGGEHLLALRRSRAARGPQPAARSAVAVAAAARAWSAVHRPHRR